MAGQEYWQLIAGSISYLSRSSLDLEIGEKKKDGKHQRRGKMRFLRNYERN